MMSPTQVNRVTEIARWIHPLCEVYPVVRDTWLPDGDWIVSAVIHNRWLLSAEVSPTGAMKIQSAKDEEDIETYWQQDIPQDIVMPASIVLERAVRALAL
jgi:hypothetical protein